MTDDTQQTHSEECWRWHRECAERKVEALEAENSELKQDLIAIAQAPYPLHDHVSRDVWERACHLVAGAAWK